MSGKVKVSNTEKSKKWYHNLPPERKEELLIRKRLASKNYVYSEEQIRKRNEYSRNYYKKLKELRESIK